MEEVSRRGPPTNRAQKFHAGGHYGQQSRRKKKKNGKGNNLKEVVGKGVGGRNAPKCGLGGTGANREKRRGPAPRNIKREKKERRG